MKAHELAKLLLSLPDYPIATHADGHTANSASSSTFGDTLKVALMERKTAHRPAVKEIVIGNLVGYVFHLETGNNIIKKMYYGSLLVDGVMLLPEKRKK